MKMRMNMKITDYEIVTEDISKSLKDEVRE